MLRMLLVAGFLMVAALAAGCDSAEDSDRTGSSMDSDSLLSDLFGGGSAGGGALPGPDLPAVGALGGACYGNGTCDAGLNCADGRCRRTEPPVSAPGSSGEPVSGSGLGSSEDPGSGGASGSGSSPGTSGEPVPSGGSGTSGEPVPSGASGTSGEPVPSGGSGASGEPVPSEVSETAECSGNEDCDDGDPCTRNRCVAGVCAHSPVPDGTALPDDVPGDCQRPVCVAGRMDWVTDDSDVPGDDGVECTVAACQVGVPVQRPTSSLCASGWVCVPELGGCTEPDEVPSDVCIGTVHEDEDPQDPQCGDGIADEGCPCAFGLVQPCFAGPPTARGVGACADGFQVCRNRDDPRWGPCVGTVGPQTETCDGRDNSCNGCIDDLPDCSPVVNCPDNEVVQPFRYYDLDASVFLDGDIETVLWSVQAPANSNRGTLESVARPQTRFFMDVSGDYVVSVQITDTLGQTYGCSWVVSAQGTGLRVELVWDTFGSVDMDLHLQRHSAQDRSWCNRTNTGDCHWANCRASQNINWGYAPTLDGAACGRDAGQTCPNPRLDQDNISSRDPEIISLDVPEDADRFRVLAVHYSGGSDITPMTHPVVSVYCGSRLAARLGEAPDRVPMPRQTSNGCNNLGWRAADITMHVDEGTGRVDCTVEPLLVDGEWDLRTGTAF